MVKISEFNSSTGVIELTCGLSAINEQQVNDLIIGSNCKTIILDFSNFTSFDFLVPGMIVRLHNSCSQNGRHLLAAGLNEIAFHLFRLCRLNEAIPVFDSVEAAAAGASSAGFPKVKASGATSYTGPRRPVDYSPWAGPVTTLSVQGMPPEAVNINVAGRKLAGPIQGFGQLWQKTYRAEISDVKTSPDELIKVLKDNFPKFQPPSNRFYASAAGIIPGEVILINADTPGGLVATGVMVLYASDTCFTFITPEGHPEAGWVTFRAYQADEKVVMQIQGLARASDPVYEVAFRLAGSKLQQQIWTYVLQSLLKHIGSSANVEVTPLCLDTSLKWQRISNVFANAQILSILYLPAILLHKIRLSREKSG